MVENRKKFNKNEKTSVKLFILKRRCGIIPLIAEKTAEPVQQYRLYYGLKVLRGKEAVKNV
jgi:hypothetical protein